MAVDTPATIGIIGAGPIGLEAALYGRYLGYDVIVFENRKLEEILSTGEGPATWEFAKDLVSPLGMKAIQAQDESWQPPGPNDRWTVSQWWANYLRPLAESDLVAESIRFDSRVATIARSDWRRHEQPTPEECEEGRGGWDFIIESGGDRPAVDALIDASGLAFQLGVADGGLQVRGDVYPSMAPPLTQVATLGTKAIELHPSAGKRTLVAGDSLEAIESLMTLLEIKSKFPATGIVWATPHDRERAPTGPIDPARFGTGRPLLEAAITKVNQVALEGNEIEWRPGSPIERIDQLNDEAVRSKWKVAIAGENPAEATFDVLHLHGQRVPDWSLERELQFWSCPVWGSIPSVSPYVKAHMPGVPPMIEPNFYIAGEKSYGRLETFRFVDGLAQIKAIFADLADRATLDLYTTPKRK
jgi:hypothetical protein